MGRGIALAWGLVALIGSPGVGQEWATKMFQTTSHEFGSVPRAAKAEFEFVFQNLYVEDVHVASVQASCGCTTPSVKNATLRTFEKGAIVAKYNTDRFYGARGATLTVTFDRPSFAQVQLQVSGYIRTDVLVNPSSIDFGLVEQGQAADKAIAVRYVGHSQWQITGVRSGNPLLTTTLKEVSRGNGVVDYHLFTHLDPSAPAGYLNDHLILTTNDWGSKEVPVAVQGIVQPAIVVSPALLSMGVVHPGEKATRQLIVKGQQPFRILSITADVPGLSFDTSQETGPKTVHMIPVSFVAGSQPGKISAAIRIQTDLGATKSITSAACAEVSAK